MDMPDDAPQRIHAQLQQLAAVFSRESDQILQEQLGIGLAQYKILRCLIENSAMQQRHIALELGQTEASISRQISLLQDKAMIETMRNPVNRREHITTLTARGERVADAAAGILLIHESSDLARLSLREQKQLLELLTKIGVSS